MSTEIRRVMLVFGVLGFAQAGCATYWQADRLEEKVDRLVENTKRETLTQIFGDQSAAITQKMETVSAEEQEKLDSLIASYEKGSTSLDEVRSSVLGVLGGSDRVVSAPKGIWVRNEEGKRAQAIGPNAKLKSCQPVQEEDLPQAISSNRGLMAFRWGKADLNGKTVLFPWELTMSAFTKEIVENTARRTAQEFLKMAGDKGWNRPVHIQVVTEPGQNLKVQHPGAEGEVFVTTDSPAPAPAENPPEGEGK